MLGLRHRTSHFPTAFAGIPHNTHVVFSLDIIPTSGQAGHAVHVPGVRHGEALHPRHVPRHGPGHLHRHRPHLPQVCVE